MLSFEYGTSKTYKLVFGSSQVDTSGLIFGVNFGVYYLENYKSVCFNTYDHVFTLCNNDGTPTQIPIQHLV
jgi:hypothetical protein